MKCIVIYFSQTGNTEKVAKAIQAGVKKAAGHCDIAKIKDVNPRRLHDYDLIGIGSPIFAMVEPLNVKTFINNMRFVGGKHAFAFSTHGTHPEFFFPSIVPRLKRRGLTVIGTADWYGDCYEILVPIPYATAGHPDEIDLKEAGDFGREMVERSRRISAGETNLIPPVPKAPKEPLGGKGRFDPKELDERFQSYPFRVKYHKDKCLYPKCRICMDNCPVDGIDLSVTPPVIARPCTSCNFCERICPTGAIDASDYLAAVTPGVDEILKEFMLRALVQPEAEGRFRRLVPEEEVGFDTPVYKVHTKHPRWIVGKGYNK